MENQAAEIRIKTIIPILDERQKRIYLAAEAESLGWGGMSFVSEVAHVDRDTLTAGKKDLATFRENPDVLLCTDPGVSDIPGKKKDGGSRIRKEGGGRKSIEETQPGITEAILRLIDGNCYGNPENPLCWTSKSTRKIADELVGEGFSISHTQVKKLLENEGFTLQTNRKLKQCGRPHEDRDAQFRHINETVKSYIENGSPAVSVDCKKKENIGNFANNGSEYSRSGSPVAVLDHDFFNAENGRAIPYGTYDIASNEGFVNVGISHDTAGFAVNSIRAWWDGMGRERYPGAKRLYITADGGGSNGSRNRLWKRELQKFANEEQIAVEVSHFPPGTSKWNKIEHRLFSQISKNWRGRPLETLLVVVNLIASTTTTTGLRVGCAVDESDYPTGIKVSDEEFDGINLVRNTFHGDWNYIVYPQ